MNMIDLGKSVQKELDYRLDSRLDDKFDKQTSETLDFSFLLVQNQLRLQLNEQIHAELYFHLKASLYD